MRTAREPIAWVLRSGKLHGLTLQRVFLLPVVFSLIAALSFSAHEGIKPPVARGQEAEPFLEPHPVVVLSDRLVCSLLSDEKRIAGIVGQDGGRAVRVDGTVYWNFGDTILPNGLLIPNTIGWSDDIDASDCIALQPKTRNDRVAPLLPKAKGELTVWPTGMEQTAPGQVHVYYTSVVSDPVTGWRPQGVGLASFDTETLEATRALGGSLLWRPGDGVPALGVRTFSDGTYLYGFLHQSRATWTTDVFLFRVPLEAVESPGSYEYWDPGDPGQWVAGLWDADAGAWDPALANIGSLWRQPGMHSGIDVAYNEFLGRWLAVYNTNFLSTVNVRTAPDITGSWDDVETTLIDCETFHPPPHRLFVCYSGSQHVYYAADGGRTIYISFANSDLYQVLLHEIRLAAPVAQWSDEQGRAVYLPQGRQPPEGFTPDGVAFYASDIPVPGFAPVHWWERTDTGEVRYSADEPAPTDVFEDRGVAFYALTDPVSAHAANAPYAPVYRWVRGQEQRYSAMNLSPAGYQPVEIAFYAACPDANGDGRSSCAESMAGVENRVVDTDGDGCPDVHELGDDPRRGGRRDPFDSWDFFDTPDGNNVRNGVVGIDELLRVLTRYGARGNPGGTGIGPTPPAPAYHPAFDRGSRIGPDPWNLGPPDGVIDLTDLMAIIAQFGHRCDL